jgi:hypothetical protein
VIECGALLAMPVSSMLKSIIKCGLRVQYFPSRAFAPMEGKGGDRERDGAVTSGII